MRNILVFLSCVAVVVAVACEESKPRRGATGTAGTSATGVAGTSATGAAGTSSAAGTDATGAAGTTAAAGTTGAAGTDPTGAAGTAAAGTTGAAGTGAAGTAAAGTTGAAGTDATGAAGTMAVPLACANMPVKSAGGSEANCGAKTTWVATAMPTPAMGLFGIPNNKLLPPYAIDGMAGTRYSSGSTMADGYYLQIDLGAAKMVSGIVVDVAADVADVANGYEVALSTDNVTYTKVAMCAAPAAAIEVINFTATMARYIRYINKGLPSNGGTSWLSIAEVGVVCN